jgi:hypothetical protein
MSSRAALPGPIYVDDDRDKLKEENNRLQREVENLQMEVQRVKNESKRSLVAIAHLQEALEPTFRGMKMIFREMDALDLPEVGSPAHSSQPTARNSNPKFAAALQRLDGKKAEVLRLLMDVGPMSMTGIKTALGGRPQTLYDATSHLGRMGLIKKADGKFVLDD